MRKYGVFIFWVALYGHCAFIYLQKNYYADLSKMALMPILILLLYAQTKNRKPSTTRTLVYGALWAAYLGDLLLLLDDTVFFLSGMLAFMVTHVLYSGLFLRLVSFNPKRSTEFILTLLGLGLVSYKLYQFLSPHIDQSIIRYGILVYMGIISFMAACAANVMSSKLFKTLGVGFFFPGAILFVLSDAVLAANMFYYKEPFLRIVVMMTYGYAQWLMVMGFIRHLKT